MAHAHFTLDTKDYKHTHPQYVILIVFPLQQRLHESTFMLSYTYIADLVKFTVHVNASKSARCTEASGT